jgi:isopentenyl phosphate kinase
VVKLGGSVLTNKSGRGAPRFLAARAKRLCRSLASVHRKSDLIIILGAGSWGHPQALRHRVGQRVLRGAARARASKEISSSVAELRGRFCSIALAAGLPVVPLAAHAVAGGGRGSSFTLEPFRWMAESGLVAVTGGDVVPDPRKGLRILSGDEIAERLVAALHPRRVVFATDVQGIWVKGRVAPRLSRAELKRVLPTVDAGRDATQGMRGKLEQAQRILLQGVPVFLVDGRDATAVARAGRDGRGPPRLRGRSLRR